jgi:hypothetical protein
LLQYIGLGDVDQRDTYEVQLLLSEGDLCYESLSPS